VNTARLFARLLDDLALLHRAAPCERLADLIVDFVEITICSHDLLGDLLLRFKLLGDVLRQQLQAFGALDLAPLGDHLRIAFRDPFREREGELLAVQLLDGVEPLLLLLGHGLPRGLDEGAVGRLQAADGLAVEQRHHAPEIAAQAAGRLRRPEIAELLRGYG
jgi:hypothetical protein